VELLLETKSYYVKNIEYFRIHIKSTLSKALALRKGDKLRIELLEILHTEGTKTILNAQKRITEY